MSTSAHINAAQISQETVGLQQDVEQQQEVVQVGIEQIKIQRKRLHLSITTDNTTNSPTAQKMTEAGQLMSLENTPSTHWFDENTGEFKDPRLEEPLEATKLLQYGMQYEIDMRSQGRICKQCPDLQTIINSGFRFGAIRYSPGLQFKEYIAIYQFQHEEHSNLAEPNGTPIPLHTAGIYVIHYYHPIAEVTISNADASYSNLLKKAKTRLRTLKTGMIALIIYRMAKGLGVNQDRLADSNKLSSFMATDPCLYYLFIVPLAQTATFMMDAEDTQHLSVPSILDVNIDSFTRHNKKILRTKGVWSIQYLQSVKHKTFCKLEESLITSGMEFNTARIFCMLTEGAQFPDVTQWYLTTNELGYAHNRPAYSDIVISRVR